MRASLADKKHQYGQACGVAHALDILGERWTLLVVRELLLGPKRFADLRAGLQGISANILSQRLAALERAGVVVKRTLAYPVSVALYELTAWGYDALPIVRSLAIWGYRSPGFDLSQPLSTTTLLLAIRDRLDLDKLGRKSAEIGLRLGFDSFILKIEGGHLEIQRGSPTSAEVLIDGSISEVAAVLYGGASLETVMVTGNMLLATQFAASLAKPLTTTSPPSGDE
jgi:DNA-binding HxlR family transcriptional regulator